MLISFDDFCRLVAHQHESKRAGLNDVSVKQVVVLAQNDPSVHHGSISGVVEYRYTILEHEDAKLFSADEKTGEPESGCSAKLVFVES